MKAAGHKRRIGIVDSLSLLLLLFTVACKREANPLMGNSNARATRDSGMFAGKDAASTLSAIGFGKIFKATKPIHLYGVHSLTISGLYINGDTVPAIYLDSCYYVHITQNHLGNSTNMGICLVNCHNIVIDYNYIENVSTCVYAENSKLGYITVNNNQFKNAQGPLPRGQFVQFDNINGPNNNICYNIGENFPGQSAPEDAINLYKSNGTAAYPIKIFGNWIRGGGPSSTGGGINLGDNGGSYQLAWNNILVNPGQYGMGVTGGDHITVEGNSIYAAAQPFTNVGMIVWAQDGYAITNCIVRNNKVNFTNGTTGHFFENDAWIGPDSPIPLGWGTNIWGARFNASILPPILLTF